MADIAIRNAFEFFSYSFAVITVIMTVLYQFVPFFRKKLLLSKMLSSASFFLTGIFAAAVHPGTYAFCMLAALFLCLLGDFFLDYKKKTFFIGVSFFSLGHIIYITTFLKVCAPSLMPNIVHMVILFFIVVLMGIVHIKMDKIRFEGKNKVMYLYSLLLIVSFVVAATRGITLAISGNMPFGLSLALGGGMFMISDAFLASQLYGVPKLRRTDAGVALFYFPAQALFALSIIFH
ncbi:MAG: lysoplasmalogenase [Clostridia bacterium]|nr:lysoplasmalogenase [Clostridia bacterium]